jgi:hypothetical protein
VSALTEGPSLGISFFALRGNVVWNDPPGLSEDSYMKKQMVHEAINRADVVVLMSYKHLDTDTSL